MRRYVLRAALLALLALSAFGFWNERLWQQEIWYPEGLRRVTLFLGIYAAWSGLLLWRRPAWFVPLTLLAAAGYTIATVGLVPLAAASFFLVSCYAVGRCVDAALALPLGLSVWMLVAGVSMHWPVNYPAAYLALLALPLLLEPRAWMAALQDLFRPVVLNGLREYAMLALVVCLLAAHWLVALKPEVGADALAMHLAIPAWVSVQHYWHFDVARAAWAVMPMGADWCYTIAYLLGGEHAARLLNLGVLITLVVLLYHAARQWLDRTGALLAAALLASTPLVQLVTGSLLVENFSALLLLAALLALWRRLPWPAAILLGAALAVKYSALSVAVVGLSILAAELRGRRALAAFLLLILFAAPPYLTAWIKTGNPLFPFPGSLGDPRFREPLALATWFDLTFRTHRYFEGQGGSLGFHYFILVPLSLLAMTRAWGRREWTTLAAAAAFTVATLAVRPNARYLYPVLPMFLVLAAPLQAVTGRALLLACVALNFYFLPAASWSHKDFCLTPLDHSDRERYLELSAPVRKLVDDLNAKHPGEPAVFLDNLQVAGLRGRAYSDSWHHEEFDRKLGRLDSPEAALRLAREMGLRFFIHPRDHPARWIAVEGFIRAYTRPLSESGAFRLSELPLGAEPRAPEYQPLGAGAYDDTAPQIRFGAGWTRDFAFREPLHGSVSYSNQPGTGFRVAFRGTAITWVYTKAANRGVAGVTIDGVHRGEVDLYSPQTLWQHPTRFEVPPGEHWLEVRILPGMNAASVDRFIDVDALIVE